MYAIIAAGGRQYRVEQGQYLLMELLPQNEGEAVEFTEVVLASNGDDIQIGTPFLKGAKVVGKVLAHGKGPKVIVYKMRPKKHYRRKKGHRQPFTRVMIESISF